VETGGRFFTGEHPAVDMDSTGVTASGKRVPSSGEKERENSTYLYKTPACQSDYCFCEIFPNTKD
jgi:hypothetical protein